MTMFSTEVLAIDAASVAEGIARGIKGQVLGALRRRGVVVSVSGGVDSAVVAALCVQALGPSRVLCLQMPDRDVPRDTLRLGRLLAQSLGVGRVVEDLTAALEALGCYERQTQAIQTVFPSFGDGWRYRLAAAPVMCDGLEAPLLAVESPSGEAQTARLPRTAYLQLVAAEGFKQRARATMAYYHADRLSYCVVGACNRVDHDQGRFVKQGDGAADLKPIAHLYRTQVEALAVHLGVPEEIRGAPERGAPATGSSPAGAGGALPASRMDLCLWAYNHGIPAIETAGPLGLAPAEIERVYRDIEANRQATRYLHGAPLLVQQVGEVGLGGVAMMRDHSRF
jgi:NAD+ synthase